MSERLFLYGALLSPSYLHPLVPDAIFLSTGTLEEWQLEFDGLPFIAPHPGGRVFGAVYSVEDDALKKLDRVADSRCHRDLLLVQTEHGAASCYAFVADECIYKHLPGEPPTDRYFSVMESGYGAHGASPDEFAGLVNAQQRAISATRLRKDRLAAAEDATWD